MIAKCRFTEGRNCRIIKEKCPYITEQQACPLYEEDLSYLYQIISALEKEKKNEEA